LGFQSRKHLDMNVVRGNFLSADKERLALRGRLESELED
jgi:hypothetical protein